MLLYPVSYLIDIGIEGNVYGNYIHPTWLFGHFLGIGKADHASTIEEGVPGLIDANDLESAVLKMNLAREFIENKDVIFILDSIYAFVIVMCLLSLEWLLRKVWGMV